MARALASARSGLWQPSGTHFPALDGIRALAALLIVGFHSYVYLGKAAAQSPFAAPPGTVARILDGMWIGVDVFFVLSGFLIGRMLFVQLRDEAAIQFRRFYLRRSFRILPAYYVVYTLSLLVLFHFPVFQPVYQGAAWSELLWRAPASYLLLSNYFPGALVPNALGLNWSLCVEEHFYLLIPALLAVLFDRVTDRWRLAALVGLLCASATTRALALASNPEVTILSGPYWLSHSHADGLLLGLIGAYGFVFEREALQRTARRVGSCTWLAALACFAAVFIWGGVFVRGPFAVIFQFSVLALGSTLLVLNGVTNDNLATRFLTLSFWRPLARLSYGIYLVHIFAILGLIAVWPHAAAEVIRSSVELALFAVCASCVAIGVATVLFFAIERPMQALGVRLSLHYTPRRSRLQDAPVAEVH